MNPQLEPDKLADKLILPDDLANKPHLMEFYGKVSWSVRVYFAEAPGWFDGNPTNLARHSPAANAARITRLAGGAERLPEAATLATQDNDHQRVLELSDYLMLSGAHTDAAKKLKVAALRACADLEINAAARNYYLVSAGEITQS